MESFQDKLERVLAEQVRVAAYNEKWPEMFEREKRHLLQCLPQGIIKRVEHFGSTAVVGMAAKPIIDMLVEVVSLRQTKQMIVPVLESQGYDYFWRPSFGEDTPPFYAWFIKRDGAGKRTHHIHMVEKDFEHWDRLLFRDYLRRHPVLAKKYQDLKIGLAQQYPSDRAAYTKAKSDFIVRVTRMAKEYYRKGIL